MSKRNVSFSMLLLVSSLIVGACSNQAGSPENPKVESGSLDNSYKGIENPKVERNVKITEEQKKQFDSMIKKDPQNPKGQDSGGHGSDSKPTV